MRRCANCGNMLLQWCAPLNKGDEPVPICQQCHCMTLTDRPSDGELLLEIRDILHALLDQQAPKRGRYDTHDYR